jgi:RNA polymerase-binding protein DksA
LIEVNSDRAQYWLGVGAQPTEAVAAILKVTGDWQSYKGEAGTEGSLRVKEVGRSKQDIFNDILKESGGTSATEAVTAKKAPAKKAPAKKAPAKKASRHASLAVKSDEKPWTAAELDEVRTGLTADVERLRIELDLASRELDDLMRDAGDGAGNDQADVGSTTFERDHEMSLANNARDMLVQTQHALERIDNGTYGICESCGQPIGKNRLMAFPRATLCLTCKQREERR